MTMQIVEHDVEEALPVLDEEHQDSFFHGGHWGQCLELLSHLCQYGESIILISGPSGIGKTSMQEALLQNSADNFNFCVINATPYLTADSLLEYIDPVLDQPHSANKDVILIIDDAQELSIDLLALLLQLKQKATSDTKLKIVLFATPELEGTVQNSVLKEDFFEHVHIIEIEPLTLTEVEAFLMQQWRLMNRREEFPFDKSKIKKIYSLSGGIPEIVQRVAKEMLSGKKDVETSDSSDGLSPLMVGLTVSFGILFCLLAFLWPAADDSIINKSVAVATIDVAKNPAEQIQPPAMPLVAATEPVMEQTSSDAPINIDIAQGLPNNVEASNELTPKPEAEPNQQVEEVVAKQNITPVSVSAPLPASEAKKDLSDDDKIARLEKKLATLQQELTGEQDARRLAEQKMQEILLKKKLTAPQKNKTLPALKSSSKNNHSKNDQRILSMPTTNYTLQLIGLRDENKIKNFIQKHKLGDKAQYYKTNFKGRPWFVVIYGNYADKEAARAAVDKLSPALKKLQPWPREYSYVQKSIRKKSTDE